MKLAFCLPGASFTRNFFESWLHIQHWIEHDPDINMGNNDVFFCTAYSPDIYQCRNRVLSMGEEGLSLNTDWEKIVPFGGRDYDYMVWIDSDTVFTPEDIKQLISHDKDVVTGIVPIGIEDRTCLGRWKQTENNAAVCYHTISELKKETDLVELEFCGFGFICVKKGVFEAMGYPWFQTTIHEIAGYKMFTSEDIGWSIRAREKGFKIYADPSVLVGHEKQLVLQANNL